MSASPGEFCVIASEAYKNLGTSSKQDLLQQVEELQQKQNTAVSSSALYLLALCIIPPARKLLHILMHTYIHTTYIHTYTHKYIHTYIHIHT